jgi:hypothetical protein
MKKRRRGDSIESSSSNARTKEKKGEENRELLCVEAAAPADEKSGRRESQFRDAFFAPKELKLKRTQLRKRCRGECPCPCLRGGAACALEDENSGARDEEGLGEGAVEDDAAEEGHVRGGAHEKRSGIRCPCVVEDVAALGKPLRSGHELNEVKLRGAIGEVAEGGAPSRNQSIEERRVPNDAVVRGIHRIQENCA